MKTLYRMTLVLCLIAAALPNTAGAVTNLKARISGNFRVQVPAGAGSRVETLPLNNKVVCDQLDVSCDDYELVLSLSSAVQLLLVPKSASAGLPTLIVFAFDSTSTALDSGKSSFVFGGSLTSAAGNVFQGLTGELQGIGKLNPSLMITKLSLDGHARGGGGDAFLTIKLSTNGLFVQGP